MKPSYATHYPIITFSPTPLTTWYLLLRHRINDQPMIIKQCQAVERQEAATIFADRLNRVDENDLYTASELLPAIKRDDELTDEERQLIAREDPLLLLL